MDHPPDVTAADRFERYAGTTELRGDLRGRSVRAFGYSFVSGGADFVIRIASTAVLARLIAPEEFGLFMIVVAVTTIADQFRDLGLSTATIQRERITHAEVTNLFWINLAAGAALTALVCALAPLLAIYFRDDRLTAITIALSVNFVLGGLVVQHEALLARQMRLGAKSLVRTLAALLSAVLAVVLASGDMGYWALVWREIARSVLIVLGVAAICPWRPGLPDRSADVRGMVGFGQALTLSYFLNVLSSSVDRFLLGRSFGPVPVALYRQPYQLVVAPMIQFMGPLYQVALPALSVLQSEPASFCRFYQKIVTTVAMVSMPLNVFLAIYARELTALVLGPDWDGAAVFFVIFGLGGILRSVVSTTGFVLVSRGRSRPLLQMSAISSLVAIVLMGIGLNWGPEGVAVGEVVSVAAMMWPWMAFSFKGSPVSAVSFLSALARPLASSVLMGASLLVFRWMWPIASPLGSVAAGMAVGAGFLVAGWWWLPGGRMEIKELTGDLMSGIRRRTAAGAAG